MSFLFVLGALRRDRVTLSVAFVVFFLYGSMIYGFLRESVVPSPS